MIKKASSLVMSGLAATMAFSGVSEAAQSGWMNGKQLDSFMKGALKQGAFSGISCKFNGNDKNGFVAGSDVKVSYNTSRKEKSSFMSSYNRWAIGDQAYIKKAASKAASEGLKAMGSDSFNHKGKSVFCVVWSRG